MAVIDYGGGDQGGYWGTGPDVVTQDYLQQIDQPGRKAVAPIPVYIPPPDPFAAQRDAYNPNAAPAGPGSSTMPASWGGPLPPGQTPPPGYDQHVVYTDQSGQGYTPEQLQTAMKNPAFMNDPLNARTRDILPQYGAVLGPPPATGGGAGTGGGGTNTTTPYDKSSQSLLMNAVLQRLSQLQKPIDTGMSDLLAKYGLAQVDQLGKAPFTDSQNAALLTQHMEPLTQARDTAKQQAAEDLSRRGFTPTSGVFQDRMKAIDQAYERGVAGVTNTLNVKGIDQVSKNNQLQLQILGALSDMSRVNQQWADQRSNDLVTTSAIPFNTDLQTLTALMNASGGNNDASSLISSLLNIDNLNQRSNEFATQQNGQDAAAMGQVIGYLLSHHADFGF